MRCESSPIEQFARLLLEAPLGHVVALPRNDLSDAALIALDHPPLAADPAELTILLSPNAEFVSEPAGRASGLRERYFEEGDVVLMNQIEEAAGRESEERRGEAEKIRQPGVDVHRAVGDAPFPNGGASRLDGAAKPFRIGEQGRQVGASPRGAADVDHLEIVRVVGRTSKPLGSNARLRASATSPLTLGRPSCL